MKGPSPLKEAFSWFDVSEEYVKGLTPIDITSDTFEQDVLDRHAEKVLQGYSKAREMLEAAAAAATTGPTDDIDYGKPLCLEPAE